MDGRKYSVRGGKEELRRKRREIFAEGKYLVCAGKEKRRRKRRKTFGGKYLEKVIVWSAEGKNNRERKGTNNLEMMIQLYTMVKKHDYHFRPHDEKRWPV